MKRLSIELLLERFFSLLSLVSFIQVCLTEEERRKNKEQRAKKIKGFTKACKCHQGND